MPCTPGKFDLQNIVPRAQRPHTTATTANVWDASTVTAPTTRDRKLHLAEGSTALVAPFESIQKRCSRWLACYLSTGVS